MIYIKNLSNRIRWVFLFLILSIICHAFDIVSLVTKGRIMTGKGDGLAQMIPFQSYLYHKFTNFSFFYNIDFGSGGDVFQSLAYYYTTSPFFYINFIIAFFLDTFTSADLSSSSTWTVLQIIFSIIKLWLIFIVMYRLLIYFKLNVLASLTGTFLYGFSSIYYLYTFTWNFFSDVMFYLPLTILGMERLYRERKAGILVLGITLTLCSNFYFSYYQFIFIFIYFLFRVIVKADTDQLERVDKIKYTVILSLISAGIAAPLLYFGISGFLQNDRSLPKMDIPLFIDYSFHYNVFYNGYYVIVSVLVLFCICSLSLYRLYYFKLCLMFIVIFFIGSWFPYFDSFYNGFSYPQRRWVYQLVFICSIISAIFIHHLKYIKRKELIVGSITVITVLFFSMVAQGIVLIWILFIPVIIIVMFYFHLTHVDNYYYLLVTLILMCHFYMNMEYIKHHINEINPEEEINLDYVRSSEYDSATQRQFIEELKQINGVHNRIDWQVSETVNSPMLQNFAGIKLYSSIFDESIYKFYEKELMIPMQYDSNSYFSGLGNRANLYSLFNVDAAVRLGHSTTVPYGFKYYKDYFEPDMSKVYTAYTNKYQLPRVRVTNNIYESSSLKSPIDKEHAMLSGVVLDGDYTYNQLRRTDDVKYKVDISRRNAQFDGHTINVTEHNGGLTFKSNIKKQDAKTLYFDMTIKLLEPDKYHFISMDDYFIYKQTKHHEYRRPNDRMLIAADNKKRIKLKLPEGKYEFELHHVYPENYEVLRAAHSYEANHEMYTSKGSIFIKLKPHDKGYAVIPMQYKDGMTAYIDGQKTSIERGNYLMTAVKVKSGTRNVVITYRPPYIEFMCLISIVSLIGMFILIRKIKLDAHTKV
ncbi:YfhO family protein [Macrococcoides canis]|uniref:YfhO family protein n=2 Tax=Macrococcoides canis TaxID=1855823 RepID=UPI00220C5AE0|nr:YfhO family protein [Macrococcus canis]UTH00982.1 YfhO family protein [Macrococcus canis]WBF52009.1 YfhO family protein [Macrococcus canis]